MAVRAGAESDPAPIGSTVTAPSGRAAPAAQDSKGGNPGNRGKT